MAETTAQKMNRNTIIVILGATGSGKSKLGIEIARKFGGEIISADSMQVYKGLDIITNKVTKEEKLLAPHHLLDVVEPLQRFTVQDYRNKTLPIIERLFETGKVPVIVGGTNYYIESLLWKVLLENHPEGMKGQKCTSNIASVDSLYVTDLASSGVVSSQFENKEEVSNIYSGQINNKEQSDSEFKYDRQKQTQIENKTYPHHEVKEMQTENIRDRIASSDELMYEKDRKRLLASQSGNVENKKIRLENKDMDMIDEAALECVPSKMLHEKLKSVDPEMAEQLHPNNKRKIIRSLQVFTQMGRKHSDILQDQRSIEGGSELGGPLRYPHSCILWLQCNQEVLDKRLDSRVDTMLQLGLVEELLDFHKKYNEERLTLKTKPDYTKGIFQSIGFKEFHEYLILTPEEKKSEKGTKLFQAGVDALKLVTRRYARRQIRWITNRFLRRPSRQVPPVYGLDATYPAQWNECVHQPATEIVESFLKGCKPSQLKPLPVTERGEKNDKKTFHCDVCDRTFVGDFQWNDHLKSKKHQKVLKRKKMFTIKPEKFNA